MDNDSVSVELAGYFVRPVERVYDACFGAVSTLHNQGSSRASIGVFSRGLPYIRPDDDWHKFQYKGRLSGLFDECRVQLPPEPQIGSCHIEDARDRWAAAYSRSDAIDGLPADPFLYLSYDAGTPTLPGFPAEHKGVASGATPSQEFFRFVDAAGGCYFGFADVNANALRGGQLYSSFPARPMTWRQELEHVDWWTSLEKRRDRVRDVYWGMYLSAPMLARLPSDLLDRFLEVDTDGEKPQTVMQYDSGAALLTMSADPLDAVLPFPSGPESPALCNAVWLRQRLREAGML